MDFSPEYITPLLGASADPFVNMKMKACNEIQMRILSGIQNRPGIGNVFVHLNLAFIAFMPLCGTDVSIKKCSTSFLNHMYGHSYSIMFYNISSEYTDCTEVI